jgi:hypothetical protein
MRKYGAWLALALLVSIAFIWDVFFFIIKHFYNLCAYIDKALEEPLEKLGKWYADIREQ